MKTKEDIARICEEMGLGALGVRTAETAKRALRLNPSKEESELPLGTSKFGGAPDVPLRFEWPYSGSIQPGETPGYEAMQYEPGPMWFVAQLNLAELPFIPEGLPLPSSGILYFFAAIQKVNLPITGCITEDWRVLYCPEVESLQRMQPPRPSDAFIEASECFSDMPPNEQGEIVFPERRINFEEDWIPDSSLQYRADIGLEYGEAFFGRRPEHLFGGYANYVQWPIAPAAADYDHVIRRQQDESEEPCEHWLLLAQIDSDRSFDLSWSGGGRAYFMITEDAARRLAFEEAVLVVQQT